MTVLSVTEYQRLPTCEKLSSPDQLAFTTLEVDCLHRIGVKLGIRVIEHISRSHVQIQHYVGLVRVDGRDIEFLPKIESSRGEQPDSSLVSHNLLQMLLTAKDTKVHIPGYAASKLAQASWLDVFIQFFCRELADQVRRGLIRRYRDEEDDLQVVRGRILLDQQVTRNLVHRERVACEFDELDENHSLNQMFKLALSRMLRLAQKSATQRMVRELLVVFDAVALRQSKGGWWRSIELDRLADRYKPAQSMANIFLSGMSPDVDGGSDDSFALLFDMNVLFEEFVGRILRQQLTKDGYIVNLQHSCHFLMHSPDTDSNLFKLIPDILVTKDGAAVCIADTKWKRMMLNERKLGVSQDDLYQMLAYADRYKCERVLMLYPFHRDSALSAGKSKRLNYQGRETTVLIGLLDLSDLSTVPEQLKDLFDQARKGRGLDGFNSNCNSSAGLTSVL